MKIWALSAVVAATVAVVACGNGGTGTGTTAGTGGTTSTTATTMHVSSSHATGVTSGTGGAGTGGAAGACGAFTYSTVAACEAVVETKCCAELMGCDTGTACDGFIKCANACPGTPTTCDATCTACIKGCETSKAAGYTDYQTLRTCYDNNCAAATGCGTQICMSKVNVANKACGDCLTTDCCTAWTACSMNMACGACIGKNTAACKANPLYKAALDCQNASQTATPPGCGQLCADSICDSGLHYPNRPACNYCLGQPDADAGGMGCCQEMDACVGDAQCKKCITGGEADMTKCTANLPLTNFNACSTSKCGTECM